MSPVLWFYAGCALGGAVGAVTAALCRSAARADTQVPLLLPGVWVVDIDPSGDCTSWVRQPVDFAAAVERLPGEIPDQP